MRVQSAPNKTLYYHMPRDEWGTEFGIRCPRKIIWGEGTGTNRPKSEKGKCEAKIGGTASEVS